MTSTQKDLKALTEETRKDLTAVLKEQLRGAGLAYEEYNAVNPRYVAYFDDSTKLAAAAEGFRNLFPLNAPDVPFVHAHVGKGFGDSLICGEREFSAMPLPNWLGSRLLRMKESLNLFAVAAERRDLTEALARGFDLASRAR